MSVASKLNAGSTPVPSGKVCLLRLGSERVPTGVPTRHNGRGRSAVGNVVSEDSELDLGSSARWLVRRRDASGSTDSQARSSVFARLQR